jgi:hypothetical protein
MTYTQAIKTPQNGWSHANDEQMLAALCENLGRICCLNPEPIFDWARRQGMDYPALLREVPSIRNPSDMVLLMAVLNDQPLDTNPNQDTT